MLTCSSILFPFDGRRVSYGGTTKNERRPAHPKEIVIDYLGFTCHTFALLALAPDGVASQRKTFFFESTRGSKRMTIPAYFRITSKLRALFAIALCPTLCLLPACGSDASPITPLVADAGTTDVGMVDSTVYTEASVLDSGLDGTSPVPDYKSITVSPLSAKIFIDGTQQFSVSALRADNGTELNVSGVAWASSDEAIATVDKVSGVAIGKSEGTALITATLGKWTGTATLSVIPNKATSLEIKPTIAVTRVGLYVQFEASALLASGKALSVTDSVSWSSSDQAIATMSSDGRARGVAGGTVTISAEYESTKATAELRVWPSNPPQLSVYPHPALIHAGRDTVAFFAAAISPGGVPMTLSNDRVKWETQDITIASINDQGIASGLKEGKNEVFYTYEGLKSDPASLLVLDASSQSRRLTVGPAFSHTPVPLRLVLGTYVRLQAELSNTPDDAFDVSAFCQWSVDKPELATVSMRESNIGSVTANSTTIGDVLVTATFEGQSAQIPLTIVSEQP